MTTMARPRRRHRSAQRERGFTLIEIMIVVAVIAILAVIVIPSFQSESNRGRAKTEVTPMFAELQVREEQFKTENGAYASAVACPATPSPELQDASSCTATGGAWETLRVVLPLTSLRCSYEVTAGTASDAVTNPSGFTFQSPPMSWYYIIATCDMDGESGDSTYFTSSVDSAIQSQNEGH